MSQNDMFGGEKLPEDFLDRIDDPEISRHWPQALIDMLEVARVALKRQGQTPETSHQHAVVIITALADYFGGRQWYLPRGAYLKNALRDKSIWDDFTGDNVRLLVEKYNLSEVLIYKILREQRALHRKKVQMELF